MTWELFLIIVGVIVALAILYAVWKSCKNTEVADFVVGNEVAATAPEPVPPTRAPEPALLARAPPASQEAPPPYHVAYTLPQRQPAQGPPYQ